VKDINSNDKGGVLKRLDGISGKVGEAKKVLK
jgi:hypothetical protein